MVRPIVATITSVLPRAFIAQPSAKDSRSDNRLTRPPLNAPPLTAQQRKSYLYRTAANLITDYHRAQSRRRRWWELIPRRPEAIDPRAHLPTDLERLFLSIAAQERALLWLAYVEGSDHREIAAVLGVKEKSVKVLLYRARVKMEKILREHGFEGGK